MRFSSPVSRPAISALALALIAGCSGSTVTLTPPRHGSTPTHSPSTPVPHGSPTAASTGPLSAAAVTTALLGVQTYFATLPHTNLNADLTALAAHMVSSGAFTAATVTYGGISATLPDGSLALVFADHLEQLGGYGTVAARVRAATPAPTPEPTATPTDPPLSGPTQHEIAILVNEEGTVSFDTPRERAFGQAFVNAGFPAAGYGVDVQDTSLDKIVALGSSGHPVDYLSLATHGMVATSTPNIIGLTHLFYALQSDQRVNSVSDATYASDIAAGRVFHAINLNYPTFVGILPEYAFTVDFLTEQLKFNPGAIVSFQACFGQSSATNAGVTATLQAAGVGRYFGWTKSVASLDSEQTDAFIFDRMLGEQSPTVTGLDAYAGQRTPPQRPFPLDDIDSILGTENRSGPDGTGVFQSVETYAVSDIGDKDNALAPPTGSTEAVQEISDFGGENVDGAPIEYSLPSIKNVAVTETGSGGTLTINGAFPATPGAVVITDASGPVPLVPTNWSTTAVTATLPSSGPGSSGTLEVLDATANIASNAVPITRWNGTFTYNENAKISSFGSQSGTGTGSLSVGMNVAIRADVHPVVDVIDTPPGPQNLYISNVTADSTGTLGTYQSSFTSSDGTQTATVASSGPVALTPFGGSGTVSSSGPVNFIQFSSNLDPVNAGPACNSAAPGPAVTGQGNVACPGFAYGAMNAGTCSDNQDGMLCAQAADYGAQIGKPSSQYGDDQDFDSSPSTLAFTMDPTTYAIAVSSTPGMTYSENFSQFSPQTETMTGSFSAPLFAPTTSTPAARRRSAGSRSHPAP